MKGAGRARPVSRAGALFVVLAAVALPAGARAQTVATAVMPDTVTVGDIFHVAVRITLPPGYEAALPDTLPVSGKVQNAGRRQIVVDTVGGRRRVAAVYALAAWRPGPQALPALTIPLIGSAGDTTAVHATLRPLDVASVLPADTAGIKPRPPKGVVGGFGFPWLMVLAGVLAAALLALLAYYLLRRRRLAPVPAAAVPTVTARERALQAMERVHAALVAGDDVRGFYFGVSAVLRQYLAEVKPALGVEYTTRELSRIARRRMEPASAATELIALLEAADLVKFAGRRPERGEALEVWDRGRDWVQGFPAPEPVEPVAEVVAA